MEASIAGRFGTVGLAVVLGLVLTAVGALSVLAPDASARRCLTAPEVAVIFDDSGSMGHTDPRRIRVEALRMLLDKPSSKRMRVGAVEFGNRAGPLFPPAKVEDEWEWMLGSLGSLRNDGFRGTGSGTSYNAAFRASRRQQPGADARIFLTDGIHNQGPIRFGLAKGAPVYVIGLNIGNSRRNRHAQALRRIARISGGRYYALKPKGRYGPDRQMARLQPVINRISARIGCSRITRTVNLTAKRKGQRFGPYRVKFGRRGAVQVLATWARPGTTVKFVNCRVIGRGGKVIADLRGSGRRGKLKVRVYTNRTNKRIVIKRPRHGWKLIFKVRIVKIKRRTPIVVQIEPGGAEAFRPDRGGSGAPDTPGEPAAPRIISVYNQVTNGMQMREDASPARLTTRPWTFCTSRGCNIGGTERRTGQAYDGAICQTSGERTTNGNDRDAVDDRNPNLFESTRYYGVRLANGTFGYISEVWINAADRGGLGLPGC